ncbi:putative porin [Pseudomonas psychrophila]|uniref:putative porin n=1 Tax=Pseudomonas psychrophila TaxID=122355 RepID=UPI0002E33E87|nr:putative porin [Pseudomonas psychrophila]
MRLVSTRVAAGLCGGLVLAMSVPASAGVDAKLLEMLKANGSISPAQYAELQTELTSEKQAQQEAAADHVKKSDLSAFEQKVAWAAKTELKGDVRVRQETVKIDGESGGKDKDRQRIRARLGAYTEIDPQVNTGIRIATGGGDDARSTNQDLDNYFDKKQLWLDMAYIDYHPTAVKNLHLVGGKMPQQWVSMGDVIWDSDINPEGLSASYKTNLGNSGVEMFGSAGYYTLKDNVNGDGVQFKNDLSLYAGQLGARFAPTDSLKVTLGGSVYDYHNDEDSTCPTTGTKTTPCALAVNGNSTSKFRLYEGFGQLDIANLPVPLSLYGQYVHNAATDSDQDDAWLVGFKSKLNAFSLDYNYRDTQRNAVVGAFTDSDFANGTTGSRGHKVKVGYEIDKNFGVGVTYFLTKADYATSTQKDASTNTLQLDVEAKF